MLNPRLINLAEKLGNEGFPGQENLDPIGDPLNPPKVMNTGKYIVLENIVCRDADGKPFEQYPQLLVKKDIERDDKGERLCNTPYEWMKYFEDKGLFLPSFALTCNILSSLHGRRDDPEITQVLTQYKDKGNGNGWHAQNTIVDWGTNKVIHYPSKNKNGDTINTGRRSIELPFKRKGIKTSTLEDAFKNQDFSGYVQNLTGLTNPETLVDLGKYYGKGVSIWTSTSQEERTALLGCGVGDLILKASNILNIYYFAARGVLIQPSKNLNNQVR